MKNIWIFSVFSAPPEYEMRYRTSKMAQELVKGGDRVTIFASSAIHNTDINLIEDRAPYIVQNYSGVDYIFVRCSTYHTNGPDRIASLIEFYFRLSKALKDFDEPDLIIAESPYPTVAHSGIVEARKHRVPCIVEVRDLWPESLVVYQGYSRYNPLIIALYWLEKWIYRNASALVFSMPGGWDYVKQKGWDSAIRQSKVFHINNGVDIKEFLRERDRYVLPDEELDDHSVFNVVYSGSIRYVNNLKPVIDAAQILQQRSGNYRFLLFGDGNERPALEEYCRQEGITNVFFKGFVEKKYIPSLISRADANLVSVRKTSLGRFGNSWNKLFEYLAAGKPIISNFRNSYDIIEEYDCGVISQEQSAESIAAAVTEVASLPLFDRKQMGNRAREAAQLFDYPYLANRLKEVIRSTFGSDASIKLVTLLVVARNEENSIGQLLQDIREQDFSHERIELIFVDSDSSDSTKAICEQFAREETSFYRVLVLDNPERFLPHGWNIALRHYQGDMIVRVDAHARIPADFIRVNVWTLEKGEDVCGGVRPTILQTSTPWRETLLLAEHSIFGSSAASYRRDIKPSYVPSVFHAAYRREVFEKVGVFDERLLRTEDNEMNYRVRKGGFRIRFNPRIHSKQLVRSSLKSMTRQKHANGYWIGRTFFVSPRSLRIYHLVPLLALLGIIALAVVGFAFSWIPLIAIASLYIGLNLLVSFISAVRSSKRNRTMFALPFVFALMHVVYGVGTLQGMLRGLFGFLFSGGKGSDAGADAVVGNG
jgi:glycosyltransferase involved in cell wall biosynthesis